MSKLTNNKKNLILDNVIVSYNAKDDNIYITSKDEDIAGDPFCISLNQGTDSENTLRKLLAKNGLINSDDIGLNLPKIVYKPEPTDPLSFDLGLTRKGFATWNPDRDSHLAISGITASGKTTFLENVLNQCLKNEDIYDVYAIGSRTEIFQPLFNNSDYEEKVADNLSGAMHLLEQVVKEMEIRYSLMNEYQVSHINELYDANNENRVKRIMLFMDDTYTHIINDLNKHQGKLMNRFGQLFRSVLTKGRAVGICVVCSEYSYGLSFFSPAVRDLFLNKVLLGRAKDRVSQTFLNSNLGTRVDPSIHGRGLIHLAFTKTPVLFQSFAKSI